MKKFLLLFLLLTSSAPAFANISITPFFIDFDAASNKRVVSVRVTNTTSEKQTYRANFINYRQKPDGTMDKITKEQEDPAAPFAEPFLTVSPRQFSIEPGVTQIINVGRKPMPNAPDGEYVSYLTIREITPPAPGKHDENQPEGFGISIKALYAVAIPVLLAKGPLDVETAIAKIENAGATEDGKNARIAVTLERGGSRSSYGSLTVLNGRETVGEVKNLRIFLPGTTRRTVIRLEKPESELKGRKLKVIYRDGRSEKSVEEEIAAF